MRERVTRDQAWESHGRWRSNRAERWLDFVRCSAFARPETVMGRLLRHVGVTHGDLVELVSTEGLEGALQSLFAAGAYVTVDEFKGRETLVRGSFRVDLGPSDLKNPLATSHVAARSGGSRSRTPPFLIDLAYVRACGIMCALYLEGHGLRDAVHGVWETPGAGARFRLLKLASFGPPPEAWFTPVLPDEPGLDPVFKVSERALRLGARLARVRWPRPQPATGEDPLVIARWARKVMDSGRSVHLFGPPSGAVQLSIAAVDAGVDLAGASATLGGEPTTEARNHSIRKSGLLGLPRYGSMESGPVGYACGNPTHPDQVHVVSDLHALITPGDGGQAVGLPDHAILITALHRAAPYCMINLSMGDRAVRGHDDCGCAVRALGWETTLHDIRSFEKFTAAGVTFSERDVVALLEQSLPARFGGGPTDYQLVESEGVDGSPRLHILVDPGVGEVDEGALLETLMSGLGDASPMARVMERHLRSFAPLEVERRPPIRTPAGKVLHLHVENRET